MSDWQAMEIAVWDRPLTPGEMYAVVEFYDQLLVGTPAPGAVAARRGTQIWIGSNDGGSGPITVTSGLCQLSCPTIVKSDNWLTNDNYNDRFRISTAEISNESGSWTSVSAVRDDVANAGWGMNLGFECTGVVCPA